MRDPKRIPVILEEIRRAWEQHPDLRLAQLIVNAIPITQPCPEVFFFEDEALLRNLRAKFPAAPAADTPHTVE